MRLWTAFCAVVASAGCAFAAPITSSFVTDPGSATISSRPMTGFATTGAQQVGISVRVEFTSGSPETIGWQSTGVTSGGAQGTGWVLRLADNSFQSPWEFVNNTGRSVTRIVVDGQPGLTVFDVVPNAEQTPGSADGRPFVVQTGPDNIVIQTTYRDAIGVLGNAPVGDLFRFMIIDITNPGGLPSGSTFTYLADTDNLDFRPEFDPDLCCWDNGRADFETAQASHQGGVATLGEKVADDFYLPPGYMHELEQIKVVMFTNSFSGLTKAVAEIYADCNGLPGQLIYTLRDVIRTDGPAVPDQPGFRQVTYTFRPDGQSDSKLKSIFLKGGSYWVSVYGLTDGRCQMDPPVCDLTYWPVGAQNAPLNGSIPVKITGRVTTTPGLTFDYAGQPWEPLDRCCIGCRNMNMEVCTRQCKILNDNGPPLATGVTGPLGSRSERSTNRQFDLKSADDFVVPPCDDQEVCYLEGCIYTNCIPPSGWVDIYANECSMPNTTRTLIASVPATYAIPTGRTTTVGTQVLREYRLEFHKPGIRLTAGRQYWLSLNVVNTLDVNSRTLFCFADDCKRTCDIRFNSAKFFNPFSGTDPVVWEPLNRDLSFLIATRDAPGVGVYAFASTPTCQVDINNDGTLDTDDIFSFLTSWFAGCP